MSTRHFHQIFGKESLKVNKSGQRILIFGATSAMAHEFAKCFAGEGGHFFLIARNRMRLAAVQADLLARGARQVEVEVADSTDFCKGQEQLLNRAIASLGHLDVAMFAHGALGVQKHSEQDAEKAVEIISINFISIVNQLTYVANYFEKRGTGTIVTISSVAGDRGRQSNYVYGAAKAGLAVFLQGLRNRLHRAHVRVIDIRPGFVSTPMTSQLRQGMLFADPADVGRGIYLAVLKGRDIVYLPWFWRWIMLVVKLIPEELFKRLRL
jgi:short-subunit dehydrogenase